MYFLNPKIWKFKFQKLAYTWQALKAYSKIWQDIQKQKSANPDKQFIGILLAEHLGDIVAATPILKELKAKYPSAHISWIVKPAYACLLDNNPFLDQIIKEKNLLTSIWLTKKNPFDHLYNLHLNQLRYDNFYKIWLENPQAENLGLTYKNYLNKYTLLEMFSRLAGLALKEEAPKLYPSLQKKQIEHEYWIIHRKSNSDEKDWKDEKWMDLLPKIWEKFDVQIVEIGTENGLEIKDKRFISLVGKSDLPISMQWIQHASFYIGVDSGPAHIANAFEIPGFIICGKYKNFEEYMVYSGAYLKQDIATVFFKDGKVPAEHTVDEIFKNIEKTYLKSQVEMLEQ